MTNRIRWFASWRLILPVGVAVFPAGCGIDCVDRVPPGTYTIDPRSIPAELDTDAMEVTVADGRVVFEYTKHDGTAMAVVYRMEPLADARAEQLEHVPRCDRDR